jgi:hypothetical protein
VPGENLTAVMASDLALNGSLLVQISDEKPITGLRCNLMNWLFRKSNITVLDAQLDILVSQMEEYELRSSKSKPSQPPVGRNQINSDVTRRSLEMYKQSLRYSSGGESSQHEDAGEIEDEIKEEEKWWRGDSVNPDRRGLNRRTVVGDLDRSLGSASTAITKQSLDNVLRSLNMKDGMTDDEVEHEVNNFFLKILLVNFRFILR